MLNFTDDYDKFVNCTDNENIIDNFIPTIFSTKPCGLSILCLISLMINTMLKPLFSQQV